MRLSLLRADGTNIPLSTLKRHFRALTEIEQAQESEAAKEVPAEPSETPVSVAVEEDDYGFVPGEQYELANVRDEHEVVSSLVFKELRDGKYHFNRVRRDGSTYERSFSKAAMRYYTVTRK